MLNLAPRSALGGTKSIPVHQEKGLHPSATYLYYSRYTGSVADLGPVSRIRCFSPPGSGMNFFFTRIPDLGSRIPDLFYYA
jgi:hypothetical protein